MFAKMNTLKVYTLSMAAVHMRMEGDLSKCIDYLFHIE